MTDWELMNEITDNDEMDYISLKLEYNELTEYDNDRIQGIEENKIRK